jgi:hypothetical protein
VILDKVLVLVELYEVEMKVLESIFFKQVLVPEHVAKVSSFVAEGVLESMSIFVENSSRA